MAIRSEGKTRNVSSNFKKLFKNVSYEQNIEFSEGNLIKT